VNLEDHLNDAISAQDPSAIAISLAAGADPNKITDGNTSLYWAVFTRNPNLVMILIEAGATPSREIPTDAGTSLHLAAENGDIEILRLLLDTDFRAAINNFDYVNRTPLICAVEANNLEVAKVLLSAGADINANNESQIGDTAIRRAAEEGTPEMVRFLLERGADPTIPGWMQLTAVDKAVLRQGLEGTRIVQILRQVLEPRFSKAELRKLFGRVK
jgi:ankyrin repeat protein